MAWAEWAGREVCRESCFCQAVDGVDCGWMRFVVSDSSSSSCTNSGSGDDEATRQAMAAALGEEPAGFLGNI